MTLFNFNKLRKSLWQWHAENPLVGREKWPGWKHNGGIIPISRIRRACFTCHAAFLVFQAKNPGATVPRGQNSFTVGICNNYCQYGRYSKGANRSFCSTRSDFPIAEWKQLLKNGSDPERFIQLSNEIGNLIVWEGEQEFEL